MKKHYRLTIIDRDGDMHYYFFLASTPWIITDYVMKEFISDGDFYGQKEVETMDISVQQMLMAPKVLIEIELL